MLNTAAKGYAWLKAPQAMNGLRRTRRSVLDAGDRLADNVIPARRRARRRRDAMMKGAAAAAVSLPLSIWLGSRLFSRRGTVSDAGLH